MISKQLRFPQKKTAASPIASRNPLSLAKLAPPGIRSSSPAFKRWISNPGPPSSVKMATSFATVHRDLTGGTRSFLQIPQAGQEGQPSREPGDIMLARERRTEQWLLYLILTHPEPHGSDGYLSHLRFFLLDAIAISYDPDNGEYGGSWDLEVRKTALVIDELVSKGTLTVGGVTMQPGHEATKMYWETRFKNQ